MRGVKGNWEGVCARLSDRGRVGLGVRGKNESEDERVKCSLRARMKLRISIK